MSILFASSKITWVELNRIEYSKQTTEVHALQHGETPVLFPSGDSFLDEIVIHNDALLKAELAASAAAASKARGPFLSICFDQNPRSFLLGLTPTSSVFDWRRSSHSCHGTISNSSPARRRAGNNSSFHEKSRGLTTLYTSSRSGWIASLTRSFPSMPASCRIVSARPVDSKL